MRRSQTIVLNLSLYYIPRFELPRKVEVIEQTFIDTVLRELSYPTCTTLCGPRSTALNV